VSEQWRQPRRQAKRTIPSLNCCLQTIHFCELNMYAKRPLKYFSTFSGIGGFELGLQRALGIERTDTLSRSTEPQIQQRREWPAMEKERSILSSDERGWGTIYNRAQSARRNTSHGYSSDSSSIEERETIPVRCIGFSEIDKYACQIYERHFPEHKNYGDITKIDADALPDFDLFVGGFPCQAFSIAGLRQGFEDTRGTLFFDIARILDARRPLHFVLENVKGLLSHDDGRTFKTIIATLVELGYGVEWQVLNSKDFGVAQNRERVFIVGHLSVEPGPQVFPFPCDAEVSGGAHQPDEGRPQAEVSHTLKGSNVKADQLFIKDARIRYLNDVPNIEHVGQDNRVFSNAGISPPISTGNNFGKLSTASSIRRLTPVECERLQGFPDHWTEGVSDTQRYKCLGNAVTVNVIEAIMTKLYGEDTCSTSKQPPMTNSKPPATTSTSVFGTWSGPPLQS
jgi:DNA (cytosine-5)-methyltransferase 1